jgi:trans-2,3-dihydro-3-hydroxyanthranilate isomerase
VTVHEFFQLDVFTAEPLTGNALAVFPQAEGLDTKDMQQIAREMNLSETTFVLPSDVATRRVRIFTPTAELPLAGHPTIGTWWLLAEQALIDLPEVPVHRVEQETGAGVLPVTIHLEDGRPTRVVMVQTLPDFLTIVDDISALETALGGRPGSIANHPPPQVVSTALPQLMVPISSLDELVALPSGGTGGELARTLRAIGTDCAMCYWMESAGASSVARCRMFAPGLGVPEDPATGSAAGALGAYLVRNQVVNPVNGTASIVVHQGAEIERPSVMHVEVDVSEDEAVTEVRVGGTAVTVIRGELTL